ncbi:cell envelope integrity protein CreD [Abyssalbus ytuae]|uniref:Cell envelope integrity protein CreD n=1 Tax=Abyssalbus ytuae TaxID=2926907 RepID=A0A9E7CSM4_9FLAO|nr:cell envelope integrity protein CreD [Abyssalbus ytuae]UOB16511.1 cell envelope integrity protein CreD [Abyssalbus ytuae]
METQKNNRFGHWIKNSITARMFMIGFLTLILLIPLFYVESLIKERSHRKADVINEINEKWGNEVVLYGPILKIPYRHYKETVKVDQKTGLATKEQQVEIREAYFFPENLTIKADVKAEAKKRSIYTSTVFHSKMDFKGEFTLPDFTSEGIKNEDIIWEKATVVINSSNLKGIRNQVKIKLNDKAYSFVPKYNKSTTGYNTIETAYYDYNKYPNYGKAIKFQYLESGFLDESSIPKEVPVKFEFNFNVNGSEQISFIPIGKETRVSMTSNWHSPSFFGNFLRLNNEKESITKDGFTADWEILQINRQFEQEFFGSLPNLLEFAFGVKLIVPVDEYQKSERTTKYGFMVISLTFLIFFLIQTLSKINIHPFQYLMIGLALTMFYTLLISLTEHSSYLTAYLISGGAVVILISLYSKSILKNYKFPLFIGLSLTALYGFIFVIIQLENYALLVGSIGLFIILSTVMFFSRKIDWNNG